MADDLDGLRDATVELVRRIRAEISERLGRAQAACSAPGASGFEAVRPPAWRRAERAARKNQPAQG